LKAKKYNPKYIPAYSPDFNPIENVFGVVKTAWRRINATRYSAWSDAHRVIRSLFDTKATPGTISRYFQHTARLLKQQVVSKQFPETSSSDPKYKQTRCA
jgi:transposase